MASGHTPQSGGPTHIGANRRDMTSDTSTAGSVGQKEDLAYIGFHVYEKQSVLFSNGLCVLALMIIIEQLTVK